jgi:hypothetical protein
MKINPQNLIKILELASIKYELDPLYLKFDNDGIYVKQMDSAGVMASIGKVGMGAFKDYEAIGDVVLDMSLIKRIKNMFKVDDYINLSKKDDKLILEGSRETYTIPLISQIPNVIPDSAYEPSQYGFILKKPKILKSFKIDITELDVEYDEIITFNYGTNELILKSNIGTTTYTKKLKTIEVKSIADSLNKNESIFNGDLLMKFVDLIKDTAWLIITEEPLYIIYHSDMIPIDITYIVAERIP